MYKIYTKQFGVPIPHIRKLFLIMRLTTIILLITLLQVSAKTYSQKISLDLKNATIPQLLQNIRQQTGYGFIYDKDLLKQLNPVTIHTENKELREVLNETFADQPLTYEIQNNIVILQIKKEPTLLDNIKAAITAFDIHGKVTDSTNLALPGATITNITQKKITKTAEDGTFTIPANTGDQITISFVGYKTVSITAAENLQYQYILHEDSKALKEVFVNTGYQTLPKERATGSFEVIDSKKLNEQVGVNILDRLKGTTSLLFDSPAQPFTIRGVNTFSTNSKPLIVVDNFPYDGDINNINPNNIDNITILKDAAAASIWGSRAGNGVMVITTKKGNFNQNMKVSLSSSVSTSDKLNFFNQQFISNADYIDIERLRFKNGAYTSLEKAVNHPYLTPVVEALIAQRDGKITSSQLENILNNYRNHDFRTDLLQLQQRPFTQNHALNVSGGTNNMNYFLSGGYSKTISEDNGSNYRLNINASNTYKITNNLSVKSNLAFTQASTTYGNKLTNLDGVAPYTNLIDNNGKALAVGPYRQSWLDTLSRGKLLDWNLYPVTDIANRERISTLNNFTTGIQLAYKFLKDFDFSVNYQFQKQLPRFTDLYKQNSFFQRNLINLYSVINNSTGNITYNYPLGDSYTETNGAATTSNNIRGLLSFAKTVNQHQINAVVGAEISNSTTGGGITNFYYAYNADPLSYATVNPFVNYPTFFGRASNPFQKTSLIAPALTNRSVSSYANVGYVYNEKYLLSGSVRQDAANVFGIDVNNKWKPQWSAGLGWNIDRESFYKLTLFPTLRVRATYGIAGISPVAGALSVIRGSGNSSFTGAPQYSVYLNGNPELQWEEVRTLNLTIDFGLKNNRINGNFQYYSKNDKNLIARFPYDPSIGTATSAPLKNIASMKGNGFEANINSINLNRSFKWVTNFNLNIQHNKITDYFLPRSSNIEYVGTGSVASPIVGQPLYQIVTYKWGGLDPQTGVARAMVNNVPIADIGAVQQNTNLSDLHFHGSASPTLFGSFNNAFTWKNINLSFNITYLMGYYFIKPSVDYEQLLRGDINQGSADYALRWQKPGDENNTNIPAFQYSNSQSSSLYSNSDILVRKGDHIRLQYINLGYTFTKRTYPSLPFQNLNLIANVANLGILWRANKDHIDPSALNGKPAPKIYSLSLNVNF